MAGTGTSRSQGQVTEMSYITACGRKASTPRTLVLPVTTRKGIKIVPIVVCRQRAAAGLCNGTSQHGLPLPETAGLCGSAGHSPTWGQVAVVPGGEEGCPSHCPNAQLYPLKLQSGAAASSWHNSLLCSPSLPFPGADRVLYLYSSPNQHASSPLDAVYFPCLLPSQRAQSQPGAASPLPSAGDTLHCVLLHTGIYFSLILVCKTVRLRRGRASQQPAWHQQEPGRLDLQLCQGSRTPALALWTVRFCNW